MANQWTNTNWVSMEVMRLFLNGLEVAQEFDTNWNDEFRKDFAVGASITIKKPARMTTRDGMTYTASPLTRESVTMTLDQPFGIDFEWDDYEKAVHAERSEAELRKNYLIPAASKLVNELDRRAALYAANRINNVFGALGTNPADEDSFLDAEARLFEKSCPEGDRKMIISAKMMASFLKGQNVQFNPSDEIAKQYKKGVVGTAFGWEWYRSNNLKRHTAGTWAGAVTVTSAGQSGSSLTITATAGDTFKVGDKFSIASVNFVNINSLQMPGGAQVQHFTVTEELTAAGGGADVLKISPAIKGPGSPYQNVDALPGAGAALTLWPGTTSPSGKSGTIGLGLSKYAFGLCFAKFDSPKAVEVCTQTRDPKTGANIRFVRQWDIKESKYMNRFDMCVGFGDLYPDEGACIVVGA
jgi:hypothetical protein